MANRGYVIVDFVTDQVLTNYPNPLRWGGEINEEDKIILNAHMFRKQTDAQEAVQYLTKLFEKEPGGADFRILPVSKQPSYRLIGNWYDILH